MQSRTMIKAVAFAAALAAGNGPRARRPSR